ncbi:MAG: YraN family protein [Actinobacteria bacterium]|uniref:Unannotated protein n=1 Tax=freshwater metagenome TaxID=449393 RepID=A0A6J5ZMF9_9ZZZZ|nr:YraN family protein [Actinomycetota bacterium]
MDSQHRRFYFRRIRSTTPDPRHVLGRAGERLALEHLQRLGYLLVARNHRTRYGEIDLIVLIGSTLVFVEVKTRRSRDAASPWDSLNHHKRKQVRRLAGAFLAENPQRPSPRSLRFDAIGILLDGRGMLVRLDHIEDAF